MNWWHDAVGYEVYVRSFADSDGDGVGDLRGVIERLEHLAWLGVDVVWLTPFFPSPQVDFGYDVADYTAVDETYGHLSDFRQLSHTAHELGLRVMVDLVPNHTSSAHPWFRAALEEPASAERDYYLFRAPAPGGGPPNNWLSHFGGSAWTLDEGSGDYYCHLFHPEQPDLNWSNPAVREAFDGILLFWIGQGVDGFRIDVAHTLMKDPELRDNPQILALPEDATPREAFNAFEHVHDHSQEASKEIYRRWKSLPGGESTLLLGEVYLLEADKSASYMGAGGLDLCLFFGLNRVDWDPVQMVEQLRRWSEASEQGFAWTVSSHDEHRAPSRFGGGERGRSRALMIWTLFCALPGMPFVYQGEELGLENGQVRPEDIQDPLGKAAYLQARDFARTPMPWDTSRHNGFTRGQPWLKSKPRKAEETVAFQRHQPDSHLHVFRELLATRRRLRDRRQGKTEWLPAPPGTAMLLTGDVLTIANLGDVPSPVEFPPGKWSLEFRINQAPSTPDIRRVDMPPLSAATYLLH